MAEPRPSRRSYAISESIRDNLAKLAALKMTTVNDIVNIALQDYIDRHRDIIGKFDKFVDENVNR